MEAKNLMIIGGVVLVAGGGYLYYQHTLDVAAHNKFDGKMAILNNSPYWFSGGIRYLIDSGDYANFGSPSKNKLLIQINSDEFNRFKDGGKFYFQNFNWDGLGVYTENDVDNINGFYMDKGKKRRVANWDFWSKLTNSTFDPPNIYIPPNLLASLPTGDPIYTLDDISPKAS